MFVVGPNHCRFWRRIDQCCCACALERNPSCRLAWPNPWPIFSCFNAGGLLASAITYGTQFIESTWAWRLPSILQCLPSALCVALLPFVPEIPRWLVANRRHEEALEILRIFKGLERAEVLKSEMEAVIETEKFVNKQNHWTRLLAAKVNRHRTFVPISFGISTELMGNFVIS